MTSTPPILEVGDNVAYSVQFLESIGMSHGDFAHARGVVTKLCPRGVLVSIDWKEEKFNGSRIHIANLAKVGLNTRFCKC